MNIDILNAVNDLVSDYVYYDRKGDEDLPMGAIQEAIKKGEITEEDIVNRFKEQLHKKLGIAMDGSHNKQPVIFRVHTGTGQVFALLPGDSIEANGSCLAFQTVIRKETQGRMENYRKVIARSRPATPNEAHDLLKEVRTICEQQGLTVEVKQKWNARKKRKPERV